MWIFKGKSALVLHSCLFHISLVSAVFYEPSACMLNALRPFALSCANLPNLDELRADDAAICVGDKQYYFCAGYEQVSSNNQNPVLVAFRNGEVWWCRDDYETGEDDGRAEGLIWFPERGELVCFFTATGVGDASVDYQRFTNQGWLKSYSDASTGGGGPKVQSLLKLDMCTGSPTGDGSFVTAQLSSGKVNSVGTVVAAGVLADKSLVLGLNASFHARNVDRSPKNCSAGAQLYYQANKWNWELTLSPNMQDASYSWTPGCAPEGLSYRNISDGSNVEIQNCGTAEFNWESRTVTQQTSSTVNPPTYIVVECSATLETTGAAEMPSTRSASTSPAGQISTGSASSSSSPTSSYSASGISESDASSSGIFFAIGVASFLMVSGMICALAWFRRRRLPSGGSHVSEASSSADDSSSNIASAYMAMPRDSSESAYSHMPIEGHVAAAAPVSLPRPVLEGTHYAELPKSK